MDDLTYLQKDALTGTYTRKHLISVLKQRVVSSKLQKEKLYILLVDIDHFKKINDKYGHLLGDELLRYVAGTLRLILESKEIKGLIFRYGGDEFVVLFSGPNPKQAFLLAKQFNLIMKNRPFLFKGRLFKITISCGLATSPDDAHGADSLLEAADKALYFSKRFGRNTTTQAGKMRSQRFKIISVVFLEVLCIAALVFFLNIYFVRSGIRENIGRLLITKLLSTVVGADTKIVLKNKTIIKARIIAEDQEKLFIIAPLDKAAATAIFRKLKFNTH